MSKNLHGHVLEEWDVVQISRGGEVEGYVCTHPHTCVFCVLLACVLEYNEAIRANVNHAIHVYQRLRDVRSLWVAHLRTRTYMYIIFVMF